VGSRGVGIMTTFLLLANSNLEVNGNQEMDLMIGSLNFCVGSSGSIRLSDPEKLDPSASETKIITVTGSSVGSSSEVNSPVSFTTARNTGEKIEELDETMENLDIGGTVDQSYTSQKDFITQSVLEFAHGSIKAVASPAIYANYALSSLKQQKKMTLQTMQQPTRKSINQGVTAKRKRRKFTSPPESGESSCQPSTTARRYPPTQEEKS
jgi:hypothetical protein